MTEPGTPTAPAHTPAKGNVLKRAEAYGQAHWKELLALTLAAIPAAFLLFHKGTQQAATSALSYPAALLGGSGSADGSTPPTPVSSTPPASGSCPAGSHWVPGTPLGGAGMGIKAIIGHCEPNTPAPYTGPKTTPAKTIPKKHDTSKWPAPAAPTVPKAQVSVKGANPLVVAAPKKGTRAVMTKAPEPPSGKFGGAGGGTARYS